MPDTRYPILSAPPRPLGLAGRTPPSSLKAVLFASDVLILVLLAALPAALPLAAGLEHSLTVHDAARAALAALGILALVAFGSYEKRLFHIREAAYRRIFAAGASALIVLAAAAVTLQLQVRFGELLITTMVGTVALCGSRSIWMRALRGRTHHTRALPNAAQFHRPKRIFDASASAIGLVAILPLLVGIAIAIKLDDGGAVLFRQKRIGLNGRPFQILKFRTMCEDAESQVEALMQQNEGSGPLFKMRADPRITRIGRILRKLSLDELPQLANVLVGTMSLVGPRPGLPREVAEYDSRAYRRLSVKPGITGLWQVSGRSDLDWHEGLSLDLQYVEQNTFTFDLRILLRTVPMVLRSRGAY